MTKGCNIFLNNTYVRTYTLSINL